MTHTENKRVLAIDPSEMGFGFAVLEGPRNLIDWGIKATPRNTLRPIQKNNYAIKRIEELIERYEPDVLVTEDYQSKGSRRRSRIRKLLERIGRISSKRIEVITYRKTELRGTFLASSFHNKSQRAVQLAEWFPELSPSVPRFRKAWMPEDNRMAIFDALALAVVHYSTHEKVETDQSLNEKELQTISN